MSSNLMKDQISRITLDVMMGIREGVGKVRVKEYRDYVETLIVAKEGGLNIDALQMPMLIDRTKQSIEAALSSQTDVGVDGGISFKMINLTGGYGKDTSQGIKIKVDMEFMSPGAPDLNILKAMSIEDLKKLQTVIKV